MARGKDHRRDSCLLRYHRLDTHEAAHACRHKDAFAMDLLLPGEHALAKEKSEATLPTPVLAAHAIAIVVGKGQPNLQVTSKCPK